MRTAPTHAPPAHVPAFIYCACMRALSCRRAKLEHKDLLSLVDTRTIAHLLLRAEGGAVSTNPDLDLRCGPWLGGGWGGMLSCMCASRWGKGGGRLCMDMHVGM